METTTNQPPTKSWINKFMDWYQEQGLILFLFFLPFVLLLWLVAIAKYYTIKILKGKKSHDYIRTN